jgi:hypothetical protein
MAVGRISGPLLKDNLLRNGVNLAFETSLLYLDVTGTRVGVNTTAPGYTLDVNGTTNSTNLNVSSTSNLATFTVSGNTIASSSSTINLLPTGASGVVYQGILSVGNFNVATNTITNTANNDDINITLTSATTAQIKLNNNVLVTGNLHATGTITADGNITLGDATTDTITFTGEVNSNILPSVTNTYNLGSASLKWNNIYVGTVNTSTLNSGNVQISGNTITTTNTNGTLILTANGTGNVQLQNLAVNNNVISSVNTNANIVLTPQGTGSVVVNTNQSLIVPVGNTATRPASPSNGMIRYNNQLNRYEGYSSAGTGNWTVLGGVTSIDGNTYITPESSPGAGNNVINFYANSVNSAYINSNGLYTLDFKTANIDITGNTISTYTTNTDMNLTPNGSGSVILGSLTFNTNTITNNTSGAVTQFVSSGTGYYSFGNTYGVGIPVGTGNNRPPTIYAQTGMIRFNTDSQSVEAFNGAAWSSVVGNAGGITSTQAQDIGIATVLTFG